MIRYGDVRTEFNNDDYDKIYDIKTDYPMWIRDIADKIIIDKYNDDYRLIGSSSYRTNNASDIDFIEIIEGASIAAIKKKFVDGMQRIIKRIMKDDDMIFFEVKAGLNHVFDIDIGECRKDMYEVSPQLHQQIKRIHRNGLITDEDFSIIDNILSKNNQNQEDYEIVKKTIRKYHVLRWNQREIIDGYKVIGDYSGRTNKVYLSESVTHINEVNIECAAVVCNKYVDCSTFYIFSLRGRQLNADKAGTTTYADMRADGLKRSIYTLLNSKIEYNPMKAAKRMMSYGILTHNTLLINKTYKIINSQYGVMYMHLSSLKVVQRLLENGGSKVDGDIIMRQLDGIRWDMSNLVFMGDVDKIKPNLAYTISELSAGDTHKAIEYIKVTIDEIKKVIFVDVKRLLESSLLYPIPFDMLPTKIPF